MMLKDFQCGWNNGQKQVLVLHIIENGEEYQKL